MGVGKRGVFTCPLGGVVAVVVVWNPTCILTLERPTLSSMLVTQPAGSRTARLASATPRERALDGFVAYYRAPGTV